MTKNEFIRLLGEWEGYELVEAERLEADEHRPRPEVHLVLRARPGVWRRCSGCQRQVMHVHDAQERWVRDLPILDAERSATGGPLFGRNLDFYGRGTLQRYSLVVVYRPRDKHAFVSVGFPGMLGCLSGMNDAGLAVAVHEVFFSRDRAPMFNPQGMPYTFCFRRILEECTTIEEAEKLVRSTPRTTLLSLVMCDREDAAVLEITPRNVVLRRGEAGICACTNHFRTDALAVLRLSLRYRRLMKAHELPRIGLGDVARKLHEVNRGRMTLQTMVFEPAPLVLHLAIGPSPTSALPLRRLELADLLTSPQSEDEGRRGKPF